MINSYLSTRNDWRIQMLWETGHSYYITDFEDTRFNRVQEGAKRMDNALSSNIALARWEIRNGQGVAELTEELAAVVALGMRV